MGRFENGVTGDVINVSTGRNADPAHLRRKRIAQIIAVQIQSRDHVEIFWPRQYLLQGDVRDRVFDDNTGARFVYRNLAPRAALDFLRAAILFRALTAPVAKCTLGELHDIALVHQGHALALILDRVGDRAMDQAHTAGATYRLDANAHANVVTLRRADFFPELRRFLLRAETDFVELLWKFLLKEIENLLRFRSARGVFDARVDVFGVFAEDYNVHFLRMFHGRGDAFEVLHRSQANEKIEKLPERDVERANPAAHRCCRGAFDADQKFAERFHRVVRQPFIEFVLGDLTGENFEPRNFLFSAESFLDRGIEYAHAGCPDIRPSAISANERNDRLIRHL